MQHQTKIHLTYVHVFTEIQKPRQVLKIEFSLSQHISAEAQRKQIHYQTESHGTFVYAIADVQNPEQKLKM